MEFVRKELVTDNEDKQPCENKNFTGVKKCRIEMDPMDIPLLIEDSTAEYVPQSLSNYISSFCTDDLDINGVCASILYILAVECGFSLIYSSEFSSNVSEKCFELNIRKLNNIEYIPYTAWVISPEKYKMVLYLGSVKYFKCELLMTVMASKLIVNIAYPTLLLCFSQFIDPTEFITFDRETKQLEFQKLKDFSCNCKNLLFNPVKCAILTSAKIKNPSLMGIPFELLVHIVKYLDIESYVRLTQTCSYFHKNISQDENIWRHFLTVSKFKILPSDNLQTAIENFKQKYREPPATPLISCQIISYVRDRDT